MITIITILTIIIITVIAIIAIITISTISTTITIITIITMVTTKIRIRITIILPPSSTNRVEQGLSPHGDIEGDVEVRLVAAGVKLHIPDKRECKTSAF